jgi:hypothetical protein
VSIIPFLDLVASGVFSNQHSAFYDRLSSAKRNRIISRLKLLYPSFLFSEFNLFYNTERRLALASSPDQYLFWFRSRIELFERVCLPAYEQLIIKPCRWFLLCDIPQSKEEEELLDYLKGRSASYQVVTSDFRDADNDLQRHYLLKPQLIRQCLSGDNSLGGHAAIITSRIDTDDAIGNLYYFNLYKYLYFRTRYYQNCSEGDPKDFIANFPIGAQVLLGESSTDGLPSAKALIFGENCFTSKIEFDKQPDQLQTVWSSPHDQVFGTLPVENLITQAPAWFQLVHGRNVANTIAHGSFDLPLDQLPSYFKALQ